MVVYLANIAFILVLGICLIYLQPTQQKRKWFCWLSSLSWILISGLRHISVGPDTIQYANSFARAGITTWKQVFHSLYRVYIEGYSPQASAENFLYKDPGYLLFQKIAHIFTDDYQVFLIIIAVIFFAAMGRFIYKNSEDPCFSFVLFSTLFYSFYAITGLRQTVATALVVFLGYEFIKERKFWKFVLVAVLAFMLHKSSIIFVPFYFLSRIKISGRYLLLIGGGTVAVFAIGSSFILWAASLIGYDRKEVYEAPTYTFTTLIVLVAIVVLLAYSQFKDKTPYKTIETNAIILAAVFSLFTLIDQSMMRIQQYYGLSMMLALPSTFSVLKDKNKLLVKIICIFALILLFIQNQPAYQFFWQ